MAQLVDVFVVGVQKGGTTALASYLRLHPGIQMSKKKEVHYFDNDEIDWACPNRDQLHEQFDWSVYDVRRAEATPIYIYWPESLKRLRDYNPNAKIIVLLRHPVLRAFSHWRMEVRRNRESLSFEEAIQAGRERVATAPNGAHRVFSYVERGLYAEQIERLLSLFPRSQVHFLRTDMLWQDTPGALVRIAEFIGIEPVSPEHEAHAPRIQSISISDSARLLLQELYAQNIGETSRLTGLDLSDWLSDDYREPMHSAATNRAVS
jgi:hypothetical protein